MKYKSSIKVKQIFFVTIFSKASIPICRIKVVLKPASSIFLNFTNANIVALRQILKKGLHSPNCYTQQIVQLIRHSVDLDLHRTTFFAEKYYVKKLVKKLKKHPG